MHRATNHVAACRNHLRTRGSAPVVIMLYAAVLWFGIAKAARAQGTAGEYQVKAAFLFHFAQLVEWPPGALSSFDQSIILCIFKDEPRQMELRSTLEGKAIGTRILHVRIMNRVEEIQGCNMLFISNDDAWRQTSILKSLRSLPVLTVGESENFLLEGGMIRFHLEGDKVRFDINVRDADLSHLKISSRLLFLATTVTSGVGIGRQR